ncbi:MAG: alpha-amylase family glycosyl hydrolase, partial [Desulfuromusa sp.]|nr:alpha-amylase family glycosyl hydrolase [Desulfuromusa sp.]
MTDINKQTLITEMEPHLAKIFPERQEEISKAIISVIDKYAPRREGNHRERWNEKDIILISYGDSIVDEKEPPLQTLYRFLSAHTAETFSIVHILPFFPYSSDDGFSVIDYRVVNQTLGDWEDIRRISDRHRLMVDVVINHVSRESLWFHDYVADQPPANDYFIDLPPETDTSMVTRPRNSPLLVPVNTHRGMRHIW